MASSIDCCASLRFCAAGVGLAAGAWDGENSWRAAEDGLTAGGSVGLVGEVAWSTVAASHSASGEFGFSRLRPGTMSAARVS